ncbi:MAG: hypothetical protein NTW31_07130 [Bacteroidetes bacterium]|nr:hypothetical protein [Bacteroidota bacterium]
MKKQNKIIIGVIIGVAVVILAVSLFFPSVYKGMTSGSFGKADKYHQEQMTENDVQLRSDFTKDTAQLRQMVTGLIYFALFTDNLSMTIDTCLTSYKLQGFDKDPANSQAIALLNDYNSFLKNNTKTLAGTTRLLAGFLLHDTASGSTDVEQTIRDFANYVNQVNQKDSVLTLALSKIDSYMLGNKTLQKKTEEIRNLKAIRDQLVIKSTQFMALTGNKQGLGNMISFAIQSQGQYSGIGALQASTAGSRVVQSDLGLEEIVARFNASNISSAFSANEVQAKFGSKVNASHDLSYVVYDKAGLQILYVSSEEKLQAICGTGNLQGVLVGSNPTIGIVELQSKDHIGVVMNALVFGSILQSSVFHGFISASQLNAILPATQLSAINSVGISAIGSGPIPLGYGGNTALQNLVSGNASLQQIISSSGALSGYQGLQGTAIGIYPPPP